MTKYAEEAERLLRSAEAGYQRVYGAVPIERRMELAQKWIDLARIETTEGESQ